MTTTTKITFPRASGHCFSHHIPADVMNIEDKTSFDTHQLFEALQYLRKQKVDLVKGDLVVFDSIAGYRNTGVAIFDGVRIIDLSPLPDDYGVLPEYFRVIEGGVPINYWSWNDDTDEGRGISHNSYVWFTHQLVRDQCLKNIRFVSNFRDDRAAIYTRFLFNGVVYFIVYDYADNNYEDVDYDTFQFKNEKTKAKCLKEFREMLESDKLLAFKFSANDGYKFDSKTLYLDSYSATYMDPPEFTQVPSFFPVMPVMLPQVLPTITPTNDEL